MQVYRATYSKQFLILVGVANLSLMKFILTGKIVTGAIKYGVFLREGFPDPKASQNGNLMSVSNHRKFELSDCQGYTPPENLFSNIGLVVRKY